MSFPNNFQWNVNLRVSDTDNMFQSIFSRIRSSLKQHFFARFAPGEWVSRLTLFQFNNPHCPVDTWISIVVITVLRWHCFYLVTCIQHSPSVHCHRFSSLVDCSILLDYCIVPFLVLLRLEVSV